MENLYYNGINIIDLAKRRKPQIHSVVSYVTKSSSFTPDYKQLFLALSFTSSPCIQLRDFAREKKVENMLIRIFWFLQHW